MPAKGSRKAHCKRGHALTEENRTVDGCRVCRDNRTAAWILAHPQRQKEHQQNWSKKNRVRIVEKSRTYRRENPDVVKSTRLKQRYGITKADQDEQLKKQNKRCAICNRPFTDDRKPETDHNHETKQVRGQLCHACNTLLGAAKENSATLSKAISYLQEWETQWNKRNTLSE